MPRSTGFGIGSPIEQMQRSQDEANKANEARYQEILGLFKNLGQAGMTRIGRQEQQAQATGTQDLISRGLGNTTIRSAMARGVASDAELARQGLQESVAMQKAGVMERRSDVGPDLGLYSSLLAQANQGPAGGGGGQTYGGISDEDRLGYDRTQAPAPPRASYEERNASAIASRARKREELSARVAASPEHVAQPETAEAQQARLAATARPTGLQPSMAEAAGPTGGRTPFYLLRGEEQARILKSGISKTQYSAGAQIGSGGGGGFRGAGATGSW